MCLSLNYSRAVPQPKPRVARRDIYVYKVLCVVDEGTPRARLESPYRSYPYSFDTPVSAMLLVRDAVWSLVKRGKSRYWDVHNGLHSFRSLEAVKACIPSTLSKNGVGGMYVFVAIVPKGSEYYVGAFGQRGDSIASDTLVVLRRDDPRSLARMANLPARAKRYRI